MFQYALLSGGQIFRQLSPGKIIKKRLKGKVMFNIIDHASSQFTLKCVNVDFFLCILIVNTFNFD